MGPRRVLRDHKVESDEGNGRVTGEANHYVPLARRKGHESVPEPLVGMSVTSCLVQPSSQHGRQRRYSQMLVFERAYSERGRANGSSFKTGKSRESRQTFAWPLHG